MEVDRLVRLHPRLWHMAEDGSWPSIREHGLLSTSALLDLYGARGEERERLEGCRRPERVMLRKLGLPGAVLRDQKPMSDAALARCLQDGLAPGEWYRLLNGRAFFWVEEERLLRLLAARPYRQEVHTVIEVDTASLVGAHEAAVRLSAINSGSTRRLPRPRGLGTFLPIAEFPVLRKVVELTVLGGVPDMARHVVSVRRLQNSQSASGGNSTR